MRDLLAQRLLLEELNTRYPLCLTVISNHRRKYEQEIQPWSLPTRYLEWSGATFLEALRCHSVAILPVSDNAFTRCKTANRVLAAIQAGLAVVADAIPSFHDFKDVTQLDNWESGLELYLSDPSRRQRDVENGQRPIQESWTNEKIVAQWKQIFLSATSDGPLCATSLPAGLRR